MKKLSAAAALCCIVALGACEKEKEKPCSSFMYGYTAPGLPATTSGTASFGKISTATLVSTPITSLTTGLYANQAAYHISEDAYYVFKSASGGATNKLLKVTFAGTVLTEYTNAAGDQYTSGLLYDQLPNKLYCLLHDTAGVASIAEVVISGTSYSINPVATATGIEAWASPATSAVDIASGDMYFAIGKASTLTYSIEKYHLGATTTTVLASGTGSLYMGLHFNGNDNMLYAIKENYAVGSTPYQFVKLATGGGSITTVGSLPMAVNNEFYSTALDACKNRYILSTATGSGWSTNVVAQLDMTGAIVQTDTTAGLLQGLDVHY